jgi:glycosyltransferase involved in cell wall biosynthesis
MRISYAITVCNELEEVKRLINFLLSNKREVDEIVVQQDELTNPSMETVAVQNYLNGLIFESKIKFVSCELNNDFGSFKNNLTSYCTKDYIFQIDADELPTEELINQLPYILEINHEVDVFLVPRINTVEGLTQEHIRQWRWNVNEKGWVNFPDYQWRIYRNSPTIKWRNKVHEVLEGFKTSTLLPAEEEYCLYHPKTIDRQVKQNDYYDTL